MGIPKRPPSVEAGPAVSPRTVWQLEVDQFSTWLAGPQGIRMLSAAMECDLVLAGREVRTKAGIADLEFDIADFATGMPAGRRAVVECFLRRADDDHFVRLLHYAAARDACASALVAPRFAPRHLRTLSYLNRNRKPGEAGLFAIQLDCFPAGARTAVELACVAAPAGLPDLAQAEQGSWLEQAAAACVRRTGARRAPCSISGCGRKLRIPTCVCDIFLEAVPDAESALLAVAFDCADPLHARNMFRHSMHLRDELLASMPEPWQAVWEDREQQRLASRIAARINTADPAAAVASIMRMQPAIDKHLSQLDRLRVKLEERT